MIQNGVYELYELERLSGGETWAHKLHPTAKMLSTAAFILVVLSLDRYSFGRLIPYIFYPTVMMALSETPYIMLLKRFLIALPFCLFAGASNILFDRNIAFELGDTAISYGVISFFVIVFRAYLCVMGVLIFVSITPLAEITSSMRRLKIPGVFVAVFEMTYRYIGLFFGEAYSMYVAYTLRNAARPGIAIKDMGSFLGQLLLRAFDRAERIYNAMKCRGYSTEYFVSCGEPFAVRDWVFLTVSCFLFVLFRLIDINILIGAIGGLN